MLMDESLRAFLFGVVGSIAVEVLRVIRVYETGRRMPARYHRWGYWVMRSLLATTGGILAVAYAVKSDILAFHIGASAPAILATLARTPPGEAELGVQKRPPAEGTQIAGSGDHPTETEEGK